MKRFIYVCFISLFMFSLSGCWGKEDLTETFSEIETQDTKQFEISEDITIDGEIYSPQIENRISEEELKGLNQELQKNNPESPTSNLAEVQESQDIQADTDTNNLPKNNPESPTSNLTEIQKSQDIQSGTDTNNLPKELKSAINEQNQKEVDEGLAILEEYFKNQKEGAGDEDD